MNLNGTESDELEVFPLGFYFYKFKFSFRIDKDIKLKKWWHIRFRGIIGSLLKADDFLYPTFFKSDNKDAALVICPSNPAETLYKKDQIITCYFTLVHGNPPDVLKFYHFLRQIKSINFLGAIATDIKLSALDQNNNYGDLDIAQEEAFRLGLAFMESKLPVWEDFLKIKILTPLTFRKEQMITPQIELDDLLKRIFQRISALYRDRLDPGYKITPYLSSSKSKTIFNNLSFSSNIVYDSKDYTGITGDVTYQKPYNQTDARLLYLGNALHVGTMTNGGNGRIEIRDADVCAIHSEFIEGLKDRQGLFSEPLISDLNNLNYIPASLKKVKIPKSTGGLRILEIPDKTDKQLQKDLCDILYKRYDHKFLPQSYAYRRGNNAARAIARIQNWKKSHRDGIIIRCDIDNFFDSIPLRSIMSKLYFMTQDYKICHLIELWLRSGTVDHRGAYEENVSGIPQGSSLSPILSNMYLHPLDIFITKEISPDFIRYADDIMILIDPLKDPLVVLQKINDFITQKLSLSLNKEFHVAEINDSFEFLGINFWGKNNLSLSKEKLWKISWKATHYLKIDPAFDKNIEYISSLKTYYGKLLSPVDIDEIDNALHSVYLSHVSGLNDTGKRKAFIDIIKKNGFINQDFINKKPFRITRKKEKNEAIKSIDSKLKVQKQKYLSERAIEYEVVITQGGAFLGKEKNKLRISLNGRKLSLISFDKIRHICITAAGVSISSSVSQACASKSIVISYLNNIGECYMMQHNVQQNPSLIEKQLNLAEPVKSGIACAIVKNKIKNQLKLLKYFNKYEGKGDRFTNDLAISIQKIEAKLKENPIEAECEINRLFIKEAHFSSFYWDGFGVMAKYYGYKFEKREKQGAENLVNQMLNYGYAILENRVERAILAHSLSPYVGVLHSSVENRKSLVYDFMEQYRNFIVDRAILSILNKNRAIKQDQNTGMLDLETRKLIIDKINGYFSSTIQMRNQLCTLTSMMYELLESFVDVLNGKTKKIKLYNAKW